MTAAKVSYDKIHSIHVYSLSPSPIHVSFFWFVYSILEVNRVLFRMLA